MADPTTSNLRVPAELELAGQQLNTKATEIVGQLDSLIGKLVPLQDTWEGPAQSYYQGLQNEWNVAADGLFGPTGVLGQIAAAMNVSWNNYADSEWANVRTWKN
ncbi:WXG100 family type VII secretion target [Micromonospora sp. LH3U1]|uniref:WXG100 family type VII secretion target n=1 Tax=Micromonospora sp. LH3U1 TaxID=3018339 RepID=UPI002349AD39|nr:WXG100 family type VII secretion target [Micromonospora sp. LH3U1]WCN83233.1 WXG100 family type VII secretion target [Micromonospora sp. LH3U1]